jgi:hypothetical protein
MINEQLNYVIFDYNEVDKINFNEVSETSKDTLRLSVDKLKTFIKWIGNEPLCVSNLNSKSIIYNHTEILNILSQPEWVGYNPISGTTQ